MKRLFVAPHLDDGAVSFGGTLLADAATDSDGPQTLVATVFSRSNFVKTGPGDAEKITKIRQAEEHAAMASVGAETRFLDFQECLLRGYTITNVLDYPKRIDPALDPDSVDRIAAALELCFRDADQVLIPLAHGARAHADHILVRDACLEAFGRFPDLDALIYEDIPYIDDAVRDELSNLDGLAYSEHAIDLDAKISLIRRYESQPINDWETMIRAAAGTPPIERTWRIKDTHRYAGVLRSKT